MTLQTPPLTRIVLIACAGLCIVSLKSLVLALPISLGSAGPANWAVLEIAGDGVNRPVETDQENVSGAAAPPHGFINGNVGLANISHITTSAGNFPIQGTVFLGDQSTADAATAANATGGVVPNEPLLAQAATDARNASAAAAALAPSGGGLGLTSITAGGNLTPGVYQLSDLNLPNSAVLKLAAGGSYIFDITGTLALHSAKILLANGLSPGDVLFNVTGTTGVAFSGGLNNESILNGIILAPDAQISLTPGLVNGEIIGGENINIASGGSVNGIRVPDTGSSLTLLLFSLGLLFLLKRKFFPHSTVARP
jgi:choice-of-anchor A domain-containing protein